jgi:hypothetical protein
MSQFDSGVAPDVTAGRVELPYRPAGRLVVVKGRTDAVMIFTPCADETLVDLSRAALDAFNRRALDQSPPSCRWKRPAIDPDSAERYRAVRILLSSTRGLHFGGNCSPLIPPTA